MSTENNSESRYGATDEGFDEDDELFTRNTGRKSAKKDSTESTTEETGTDADTESATETEESKSTENVEKSTGETVEYDDESTQSEQPTASSSPVEEAVVGEGTPSPETKSTAETDEATDSQPGVPEIDVSVVDPAYDNEFPFIFERSGTQDAREHDWIYFQPHVEDAYTEAKRQAEDIYGDKMTETDVKEAIFIAGLQNFGDAVDILHEWGFRTDSQE